MSDLVAGNFVVNGKSYELHQVTGVVLDTNTRSETSVSSYGGGGGGMVVGGTGSVSNAPVSVTSTTTRYTKIFLRDREGTEHGIQLVDFDVLCRPGHVLTMVTSYKNGGKKGFYFAAYNHNTKRLSFDIDVLGEYLRPAFIPYILTFALKLAAANAAILAVCWMIAQLTDFSPIYALAVISILVSFVMLSAGNGLRKHAGEKRARAYADGPEAGELRKKLADISTKEFVAA